MELNQIRYFLAAAQNEHITRTADKLHIAQPALTKSIHRLEEELGVPLFLSKGRNIVLSEYGKYLMKRLTPVIEELDRIPEDLTTMSRLEDRTIHLNVLAASTIITNAIIEYNRTHKDINFCLMQNAESDLYDICITTSSFYRIPDFKIEDEFKITEKIFLAVPVSHYLAQKESVELTDAANERFISIMGSRQFRWICDSFCEQSGFKPNIIFESDNPATVKKMIGARMGIGFWPEYTWGSLKDSSVKLIEISSPVCQRDILFNYRPNKVDNTSVKSFFSFLRKYCARKGL